MGFLVSLNRKMYLTSYIHKLQTRINDITAQKLNLTDTITKLNSQISDIGNADSPAVKKLQARRTELENFEKQIDLQLQKIQTQLQAANTELQSADQMLQSSIQKSFSYNAG